MKLEFLVTVTFPDGGALVQPLHILKAVSQKMRELYGLDYEVDVSDVEFHKYIENYRNSFKINELPSSEDGQNILVESINALRDSVDKLTRSLPQEKKKTTSTIGW